MKLKSYAFCQIVGEIEDKILVAKEKYVTENLTPPMILLLPFKLYYDLQANCSNEKEYLRGKMFLGMIIDYNYDSKEIKILSQPIFY